MHAEDRKALVNIGKSMVVLIGVMIALISLANTLS